MDKKGQPVNERGFRVDPATGDILEKESGYKVFDQDELDEREDLPPPFNRERHNFNPHDIRGTFDKDKDGEEVIIQKPDGTYVDKYGRRVNEAGWLIDKEGNIVDRKGRKKLDKTQLD